MSDTANTNLKAKVLIGLDYGTKKTGIAIGQTFTQSANSLKSIPINGLPAKHELDKIIQEWQPELAVIGKPGIPQPAFQKKLNAVARFLKETYQIESTFIDESLTTEQANFEMYSDQLKRNRKQKVRDAISARLILETYMLG